MLQNYFDTANAECEREPELAYLGAGSKNKIVALCLRCNNLL